MSTEFINFLPPPGDAIANYVRTSPANTQAKSVPSTFIEAMTIREAVFVHEQHVPLENELDVDDARSFHWVVYASVSNPSGSTGRKGSQTATLPVGTVRLVPPPHPPHPQPGSQHMIDNAEGLEVQGDDGSTNSSLHDGKEPFVKIGRLATLRAYRGLGLARLLMDTALEWASKHPEAILPSQSPTSWEAAKVEAGMGERERRWRGLVLVHAQTTVEGIYKRMGFEKDEQMGGWDEEGIAHVAMWRRIPVEAEKRRMS